MERLAQLELGPIEAATAAGIERTFIRDIVDGRKKSVRADSMVKLARALKLDPARLADGELVPAVAPQPRLVSSYDPDPDENGKGYSREFWKPEIEGALPEIDVKLGAGEGNVGEIIQLPSGHDTFSGHKVLTEWKLSQHWLQHEVKATPSATVVMEIVGDSMSPTYQPGDRVLVDMTQNRLVSDTVYAISDGMGEPQIKRLQRVPFSDPARVKIISDNPALETFEVDLDRLVIIGRICSVLAVR